MSLTYLCNLTECVVSVVRVADSLDGLRGEGVLNIAIYIIIPPPERVCHTNPFILVAVYERFFILEYDKNQESRIYFPQKVTYAINECCVDFSRKPENIFLLNFCELKIKY